MSRDYSKFKVKVSAKYGKLARKAIGENIVREVIKRSGSGLDKNDQQFKSGYSKQYADSIPGKVTGKKQGATPNLRLTGEMLESLQIVSEKKGEIVIGYKKDGNEDLIAKAEGNIRGTYGQQKGSREKSRDFMGISKSRLDNILDKFPKDDPGKIKEEIEKLKASERIKNIDVKVDK